MMALVTSSAMNRRSVMVAPTSAPPSPGTRGRTGAGCEMGGGGSAPALPGNAAGRAPDEAERP